MMGTGLFSQIAALENKLNQLQKFIITISAKIVLADYHKQQTSYHKQLTILFIHKTPKLVSTLAMEQYSAVFKKIISLFKELIFFSETKCTVSMSKSTLTDVG